MLGVPDFDLIAEVSDVPGAPSTSWRVGREPWRSSSSSRIRWRSDERLARRAKLGSLRKVAGREGRTRDTDAVRAG
jgi:hypothetical protein